MLEPVIGRDGQPILRRGKPVMRKVEVRKRRNGIPYCESNCLPGETISVKRFVALIERMLAIPYPKAAPTAPAAVASRRRRRAR